MSDLAATAGLALASLALGPLVQDDWRRRLQPVLADSRLGSGASQLVASPPGFVVLAATLAVLGAVSLLGRAAVAWAGPLAVPAVCGVAGAALAGPAYALYREAYLPWWQRTMVPSLVPLGARWLVCRPALPLACAGLLVAVGGVGWGLLGMEAAALVGWVAILAMPGWVAALARRAIARAERELATLLPQVAAGLRRQEHLTPLLSRIAESCAEVDEVSGRLRHCPLVIGLMHCCTSASRINPGLHNVSEQLRSSVIPAAQQAGIALEGWQLGVDVPLALEDIARLTTAEHDFAARVDGLVRPVISQARNMLLVAPVTVLVLSWRQPQVLESMLQRPALYAVLLAAASTALAFVILRSTMRTLR